MKQLIFIIFLSLTLYPSFAMGEDRKDGTITVLEHGMEYSPPLSKWFKPERCDENPGEYIYLTLGNSEPQLFKVKQSSFKRAMPGSINKVSKEGELYRLSIDEKSGCREKPLSVAMVLFSLEKNYSIMLKLRDNNHDADLLKLRDSPACKEVEKGLVRCGGMQTIHGERQRVVYLMASNPEELQTSGGPLRVRCIFLDGKDEACSAQDVIGASTSDVTYEIVAKGEQTLEQIRNLHQEAWRFVDSALIKN